MKSVADAASVPAGALFQQRSFSLNDAKKLQCQIIRKLRGRRSQAFCNKRLGYRSNQVSRWENGYAPVNWDDFCRYSRLFGVDAYDELDAALAWKSLSKNSRAIAEALLLGANISVIASGLQRSEQTVRRWQQGKGQLRLTDVLLLVELQYAALPAFVTRLCPSLDCVAFQGQAENQMQEIDLIANHPWMGAVTSCLELAEYQKLKKHSNEFIANKTGLSTEIVRSTLLRLQKSGIVRYHRCKYHPPSNWTDISPGEAETKQEIFKYWGNRILDDLDFSLPKNSKSAYLLYPASAEVQDKIELKARTFYKEICELIAADRSQPKEQVRLLQLQLVDTADLNQP